MDYCITVDMEYVWSCYQCNDDVSVKIRSVTWWIWVSIAYHSNSNTA